MKAGGEERRRRRVGSNVPLTGGAVSRPCQFRGGELSTALVGVPVSPGGGAVTLTGVRPGVLVPSQCRHNTSTVDIRNLTGNIESYLSTTHPHWCHQSFRIKSFDLIIYKIKYADVSVPLLLLAIHTIKNKFTH